MIWRYGTQSMIRVGLNEPIMREVLGQMMKHTEYDGLTESVMEESAEDSPVGKSL